LTSAVREILFVAGEHSGDLHASSVARELVAQGAQFRLRGVGGDLMHSAGVQIDEHIRGLAVLGLVEVLRHLPKHWAMLRDVRERLNSGSVALVVLVDYPGFNMRVAEAAAAAGVPVLYYIVPQVWAWGSKRLEKLSKWVRRAAVILPFEESLLRDHGIDATFVGHPLLDRAAGAPDRAAARRELGVAPEARLLALFPGSRAQEIARHLDPFVESAVLLRKQLPDLQVLVSAAPHVVIDTRRCPFPIVRHASFPILRAADAALCKSGTTTLEASVAGCPHVVAYRTHPVTYAVARRLVKIPYIGLVNVVAGREVAREFIQHGLRPDRIAAALGPLLQPGSAERTRMVDELAEVRRALGEPGAAQRVAAIARELAEAGRT
jgi:lipid-A-disaccharide synthase